MTEKPKFELKVVDSKPQRTYKKGTSKYLPILEAFKKATEKQPFKPVIVSMDGLESNYLRTQLKKLIDSRNEPITVSVTNNVVYLERKEEPQVKKLS